MNWNELLERWGLDVPDHERISRARSIPVRSDDPQGQVWKANGRHTVEIPTGTCTCPDFKTRQRAKGQACKHLVAVALKIEVQGGVPTQPPVPAMPPVRNGNGWPGREIARAVGGAIEGLADEIGQHVMMGDLPLVVGPTGSGKTSAVHRVAQALGWGLEEVAGSDSWTEVDLVGCWTPARKWAWGAPGSCFSESARGRAGAGFRGRGDAL